MQPKALVAQVLLCPILDYAGTTGSRREFAAGYLVDEDTLQHDLRHYLVEVEQAADPRVSSDCNRPRTLGS